MTLDDRSMEFRWVPLTKAAELVGKRFHTDWSASDPAMLEYDVKSAPDKEAWHRANHVQDKLYAYISGGLVLAYAWTDDGSAITNLPLHWVTDPEFTLCLRTGRFRQAIDVWEPLWVDESELIAALPKNGRPREKHTFEWAKIVHEAWMFALRRELLPTNAEIVRHLGDWCPANKQAIPDGSHLSEVAKTVLDFLNENKTGRQNLESESCEAVGESGE